ncbi:hypothetical protein BGX38DRAFT_1206842 [Terfezia claveryi]|nr:hypothetical protein BGX38DRAFT_1206842 [Terfezia claveryi]
MFRFQGYPRCLTSPLPPGISQPLKSVEFLKTAVVRKSLLLHTTDARRYFKQSEIVLYRQAP